MANPKPLTDDSGEVRELTGEDLSKAVPLSELPDRLKELLASPERTVLPEADRKKGKRTAA
jgi:hypothetical protein